MNQNNSYSNIKVFPIFAFQACTSYNICGSIVTSITITTSWALGVAVTDRKFTAWTFKSAKLKLFIVRDLVSGSSIDSKKEKKDRRKAFL